MAPNNNYSLTEHDVHNVLFQLSSFFLIYHDIVMLTLYSEKSVLGDHYFQQNVVCKDRWSLRKCMTIKHGLLKQVGLLLDMSHKTCFTAILSFTTLRSFFLFQSISKCTQHIEDEKHKHNIFSPLPVMGFLCGQCLCVFPTQICCQSHIEKWNHQQLAFPFSGMLFIQIIIIKFKMAARLIILSDDWQKIKIYIHVYTLYIINQA